MPDLIGVDHARLASYSLSRAISSAFRPLTGSSLLTSSFLSSATFMPEKSGASSLASAAFAFFFGFSSSAGSGSCSRRGADSAAGAFSSGAGDPFASSRARLRSSSRFFAPSGTCTEYLISSSSSPLFTVMVFVFRFGSAASAGLACFSAMISSNDLGSAGALALGFRALPAAKLGSSVVTSSTAAARAAAAARNLALASIAEAFGAAAAGFLAIILALTPGADPPFPWPFCFCCCVGRISPGDLGLGYSFFPSPLFF
mmetsp:Transcript_14405/g.58727  ORF Transcript_14405/g.58727 Transcript_14405/m.58727 type:complete len:258 (+) Transcript_14405:98-871(+)